MIVLKKRVFCSLLAVLVLSLSIPHITWADEVASGNCGPDENETSVAWSLDDAGTLTISGTGDMKEFDTKDDVPWKDNKETIKAIEIKEGVTSIGDYAFADCPITSITIPANIEYIGSSAFANCSVTSITIPNKVTSVGENAFTGCSNLNTLFYKKGLDISSAGIPTTAAAIAYEVTKEDTDKEVTLVDASADVTIPCNAMGEGYKIVGNDKGEMITLTHTVTPWTDVEGQPNKQTGTCDICGATVERTTTGTGEATSGEGESKGTGEATSDEGESKNTGKATVGHYKKTGEKRNHAILILSLSSMLTLGLLLVIRMKKKAI